MLPGAVTFPDETVATDAFDVDQLTVASALDGLMVAVRVADSPTFRSRLWLLSETDSTATGLGGSWLPGCSGVSQPARQQVRTAEKARKKALKYFMANGIAINHCNLWKNRDICKMSGGFPRLKKNS